MKKLICAKDIEQLYREGELVISVDKQTIITPSARDLADEYQMTFENKVLENINMLAGTQEITKEYLVTLLKSMLQDAGIGGFEKAPFDYETHASGLKIIRGSTVKLAPLTNKDVGVSYQEILTLPENNYTLGILEIKQNKFTEETQLESVNYVIKGELQVTIDGATFKASQGDIIFVPSEATVSWFTPEEVTILAGKFKSGG